MTNLATIVQAACVTVLLITNNIASAHVHTTPNHYDTERNLTALINENGDTHQFFYDGNERLIKEIGFDGRTQHYQYNAAGHLIQHLDSGEVITEFERDALGQLVTKLSRLVGDSKDSSRERSRYQYDPIGQLISTYNAHQLVEFQYSPVGQVLSETHVEVRDHQQWPKTTQSRDRKSTRLNSSHLGRSRMPSSA